MALDMIHLFFLNFWGGVEPSPHRTPATRGTVLSAPGGDDDVR
jgi:hypothetical protein